MGKTNKERIAVIEEKTSSLRQQFDKQVLSCSKTFGSIERKLDVVNTEQGETRDAIKSLASAIKANTKNINKNISNKVSGSQMSGRDRALLYGTAITAICGFLTAIVPEIVRFLSGV